MYTSTEYSSVRLSLLVLGGAWAIGSAWLVGEVETKDWIPIVLSGLGLIVALGTALWSGVQQRRHLAMGFVVTLWDRWSSTEMVQVRNQCWNALEAAAIEKGKKRIGHLRSGSLPTYEAVARVNHFLADLYDFISAGLLDLREVRALFRDTLQSYYCHLHFVSIGDGMATGTGQAQQQWFEEKVLGLGRMLDLTQAASFQRYRRTFEENQIAADASEGQNGAASA